MCGCLNAGILASMGKEEQSGRNKYLNFKRRSGGRKEVFGTVYWNDENTVSVPQDWTVVELSSISL